jgi:acyl-CoA synthetase (AMP-forming)/AMP-acid ligase II
MMPAASRVASRLIGAAQPEPAAPDLVTLLARAAPHASGVTLVGLREETTRVSWGEIRDRAMRVASALADRGIEPGDRIALLLRTELAFLDAFFGAVLAGAVPVPLYPPVRLGRLDEWIVATARMIAAADARLVLTGASVKPLVGEVLARIGPDLGCSTVEPLAREHGSLERSVRPDDLALIQYSSGSTTDPKPIALTHDALVAQIASFHTALDPGPSDALVSWLPLYHDMGLIGGLLGALAYPGPAALLAPEHFLARPALWLRTISRHRGTISAAPDFAYAYATRRVADAELRGVDLSCWRAALDGAETISADTLRRFTERFSRHGFDGRALMPVYGLSEAALAVTFSPSSGWSSVRVDPASLRDGSSTAPGGREVVSVGTPVPGVEVEVRNESGGVVAEGHLGRIHVRSRSVMRGYFESPAATARVLAGGWLDTGDLGFVLEGRLHVHGRAKDVIVVRGVNHPPDELEAPLWRVPGIRTGCAVAIAPLRGDGREAVVVLAERSGRAADDGQVAARAREAVLHATGIAPDELVLLAPGTLPRTSSGKMRRAEAARRFAGGTLTPPARVNALSMGAAMVRSAVSLAWSRAARRARPSRASRDGRRHTSSRRS